MLWRPIHENHAIERMGTIFQLASPAPSKLWAALLSELEPIFAESGLVAVQPQYEPTTPPPAVFPVSPPGNAPPLNMSVLFNINGMVIGGGASGAGRHFRTVEGTEDVHIHPSQFVYSTTVYDRWQRYHERLQLLLLPALRRALGWTGVTLLKLECWDRFKFVGAADDADYSSLLRSESVLVPTFSATIRGLWHSHVGFFVPAPPGIARLYNLNIDVINQPPNSLTQVDAQPQSAQRSVGIYSMVQDTIGEDSESQSGEGLMSQLSEIHGILNRQFGDVVTDSVGGMISLAHSSEPVLL